MKRRQTARYSGPRVITAALGVLFVLFLLYQGGRWLEKRNANPEARGDHLERYAYGETIEMDGVRYRKKPGLTTVLLMGIDRESGVSISGNRNGGQADFLRLMVIDPEAKTISQIQIDRDTMTPITILGVLGNNSGIRTTQICLSHSFGDGREQSCELTMEAVSNLLLGTQIDHYVAMNLDGILVLNDWAGGVTVTLRDDFSSLDTSMTPGTTLTLTGEQAEIYIRSRRSVGVGTNEARMERQQNYISLLSAKLVDRLGKSEEEIGALYDALESYLTTDMSRGRLINMLWEARNYVDVPVAEPDGVYEIGADGFMEFHVDEAGLKELVLELFYIPVE